MMSLKNCLAISPFSTRPLPTVICGILITIAFSTTRPAKAEPNGRPWATSVHNLMIDLAFPNEDFFCREEMKRGSLNVDTLQGPNEAYMHAMRKSGESVETAIKKTWEFIDRKYADARRDPYSDLGCYLRGQALHPIMDGTSPAHRGTQAWEPLSHPGQVFEHGDWVARLRDFLPFPLDVALPHSHEDMDYIDDHPAALDETVSIMRAVDQVELKIMGY